MKEQIVYAIRIARVESSGLKIMHVKIGITKNLDTTIQSYSRGNPETVLLNLWQTNPNLSANSCENGVHKLASKYAYSRDREKFIFLQDTYLDFADNVHSLLLQTTRDDVKQWNTVGEKREGTESENTFISSSISRMKGKKSFHQDKYVRQASKPGTMTYETYELIKIKKHINWKELYEQLKTKGHNPPDKPTSTIGAILTALINAGMISKRGKAENSLYEYIDHSNSEKISIPTYSSTPVKETTRNKDQLQDYLYPVIKLVKSGMRHPEAFKKIANDLNVTHATVSARCTRDIGISTYEFSDYINTGKIVDYLKKKFPDKNDNIDRNL